MTEKYEASALDEQVKGIVAYVNKEADAARKSVRTQFVVLAIIGLILVGYFAVANSWMRDVTEPAELAKEAGKLLDDNVPDLAESLEKLVRESTPQVADFISKQAVEQGVPFIVGRSEAYLVGYIGQMTGETAVLMEDAFDKVLAENRESIREAIKEKRAGDEPSQALQPLRDRLHAAFRDQTTGKHTEAGQKIDKSLTALRNLNLRLNALATKKPEAMDRKEQMASRLLQTYWRFIKTNKTPGLDVDDVPPQ